MHPFLAGPLGVLVGAVAASGAWGVEAALLVRGGATLDLETFGVSLGAVAAMGGALGFATGVTGLWGGSWWLAFAISWAAWLLGASVGAELPGAAGASVVGVIAAAGWAFGQLIGRTPLPPWLQLGLAAEGCAFLTLAAPVHLHVLPAAFDTLGIAASLWLAVVVSPLAVLVAGLRDSVSVPAVIGVAGTFGAGFGAAMVHLSPAANDTTAAEAPAAEAPAAGAGPLMVVVSVAGLRADRLGISGYERPVTPAIDAFARTAVHYTEASSPAPWSPPAVASLLTAQWPYRHGAGARWGGVALDRMIRADSPQWAESFARAGYATAAFVGDPSHRVYGIGRGFQRWSDTPARGPLPAWLAPAVRLGAPFPVRRGAEEVVDDALRWLTDHPSGGRLLYVGLADAGGPFDVTAADQARVGLTNRPWPADAHDAALRRVDTAVERLLSALPRDAVVVLVGERGVRSLETRGGDHLWGHHVHRELVHVPLLVRAPSVAARQVSEPVSVIDVGPTLLFMARLPDVDGVDGRRLERVLGGDEPERIVLSEATRYGAPGRSARRGRYRLVADGGAERLFDLAEDPLETQALGQEPGVEAVRRELRAALPPDASVTAPPSWMESAGQVAARFLP